MAVPLAYRQRLARKLARLVKFGQRWASSNVAHDRPDARFVFVLGSQRCGTRLPMQAMDCSSQIITYSEGASPFFNRVLLRPLDVIEVLRRRSPFPLIALKPICESHRINELLERFPRSRAVWIFRNYDDAVRSASAKWSSGKEAVRRLAVGDLRGAGWRAGGLSKSKLELVKRLYSDRMTLDDANAVMWCLRNGLFFDLAADIHPDVLLVQYEKIVGRPRESFRRMFAFLDVPTPSSVERVARQSGASGRTAPNLSCEIRGLCEELYQRLIESHAASQNRITC